MEVKEQQEELEPVLLTPASPLGARGGQGHARRSWMVAVAAFGIVAAVVISGIVPRVKARATLRAETNRLAVPTVIVVQPRRSAPGQEIVLPANVQAFKDAPIYARTNGYLKRWYADIGAHVKAGQLLAEIDTPEVEQQLHQARADLSTAEANLRLSEITATRYQGLLKTDSVSQQDSDNATSDFAARKAIVQSFQANVRRLEELRSFQRIYAPFDGIITARNTDIGQLIDSGSSGGPKAELFHIAAPDTLRVYVNVPQIYSKAMKAGLKADLVLAEFPGRRFAGELVRTADAIDTSTRTLLVEIAVSNPTGELLTGAYAEVHMKLPGSVTTFTVPVNSLLFRSEGLRVASVTNDRVQLIPITIGRDFGSEVEVVTGLNGDEKLIVNPADSIVSGQPVRIAQPGTQPPAGGL
jgi:RND family efflux transporter MFP subunit